MAVKKKKYSRSQQAAIKYASYLEFMCGSASAHHFQKGFERGWDAATAAAKKRQKQIERANSDEDRITGQYFDRTSVVHRKQCRPQKGER